MRQVDPNDPFKGLHTKADAKPLWYWLAALVVVLALCAALFVGLAS